MNKIKKEEEEKRERKKEEYICLLFIVLKHFFTDSLFACMCVILPFPTRGQ